MHIASTNRTHGCHEAQSMKQDITAHRHGMLCSRRRAWGRSWRTAAQHAAHQARSMGQVMAHSGTACSAPGAEHGAGHGAQRHGMQCTGIRASGRLWRTATPHAMHREKSMRRVMARRGMACSAPGAEHGASHGAQRLGMQCTRRRRALLRVAGFLRMCGLVLPQPA